MRQRSQIGIRFFHIHALEVSAFGRGQFHGAHALDQHFSGFTLCSLKSEKRRIGGAAGNRALHRYQELMAALSGRIYFQSQDSGLSLRGIEGRAGHSGDFVACRQFDLELGRLALHDHNIREHGHAHLCLAHRNKRLCVGEKSHFARDGWSHAFARCPPEGRGLSGNQRGFNRGVSVFRFAAGDDAGAEVGESVISGNRHNELHTTGGRNGQGEGSPAGFDPQRQPGVEGDRKFPRAGEKSHVRAILLEQGKALAVLVSVENRHSCGQRNFADALAKNFSLELHCSPHTFILDVQLHFGVFDGVGKRRDVGPLGRFRRESHQPVVFVERQRDIAGIWQGQRRFFFRQSHAAKQKHHKYVFHRAPPFLFLSC